MSELVGMVGAVLFPMLWLVERYRLHGTMELEEVNPWYVLLYVAGSVLLLYYAFTVRNLPFVICFLMMSMFTLTEFVLLVGVRRSQRGKES